MQNSKVINIQLELLKIDCVYYSKRLASYVNAWYHWYIKQICEKFNSLS